MFSKAEIRDLATAWLVLGLCFSVGVLFSRSISLFPNRLMLALIAVGTGFLIHELAHKLVAQRFGHQAEFRLWRMGIVIALAFALLTQGSLIFAAPGAVYILTRTDTRQHGLISVSGPASNLVLAAIFYFLIPDPGFLGDVAYFGFRINLWLAAFNLLPVWILDGRAILSWNLKVWVLMVIIAWGSMALLFLNLFPFWGG